MPRLSGGLMASAIAVILVSFAYAFLVYGPISLRAQYNADASLLGSHSASQPAVTEADVSRLPEPVRRYLRSAGVGLNSM